MTAVYEAAAPTTSVRTDGAAHALRVLGRPPPSPPTRLVPRPSLVRRLIQARGPALVVIVAPPGYGKSTLIAEWAQRDERRFLWLTPGGRGSRARRLTTSLRARRERCVVVIDPADQVAPGVMQDFVEAALADLPAGWAIAVVSRTEPRLPLGRLRAQRRLVELRTADLRMDGTEAAALLDAEEVDATAEKIASLVARTEGWPAALLLAALAARDASGRLAELDGSHHLVSDYVWDEVVASLPADLRRVAIRTSPLHELSGLSCDAILGRQGTAGDLARLADLSPLLAPTHPSHQVFRWHPIVRDALRAELRRSEPEREPELNARAAGWYLGRGDSGRAIEHAAAAGDGELVARLLSRRALGDLTQDRGRLVGGWLSALGGGVVGEDPVLALCGSFAALSQGDADEARRWSEAGLTAGRDGGPQVAAALRVAAAIAGASRAHELGETAEAAAATLAGAGAGAALCLALQGLSVHLTGDSARAGAILDAAINSIGDRAPAVAALALAQRAMIALEEQDWDAAAELTDRAREILTTSGLDSTPVCALVLAAVAASRARQGRGDEAKADLRLGLELLTALGEFRPWYGAETRILLAHASLWLADVVRARALLAEASRLARRIPDAVMFSRWFDAAWAHMDSLAEASLSGPSSLTIAELRVLRFLPSHRSFREIGAQLNVSGNTVKTQAHAIYRKLGVASRSEAVARALEAGILSPVR
jgi:LuxR family maltose regulon positive regulatory protein